MRFDFIGADDGTRLSKTYDLGADGLAETPYPMVKYVTSETVECSTTLEWYNAIKDHGEQGRALMKGLLDRPLTGESRAGHTRSTEDTQWICLDLDFEDGWQDVDAFVADLNINWANTSYVWHHSSSAGIKNPIGLRGHLFMMLDAPITPAALKLWLTMRNLQIPELRERITLAPNKQTPKFPLDVTTCQNDKALFIAPPTVTGMEDPVAERYVHRSKNRETGTAALDVPALTDVETATAERVNELRKAQGLPKVKARYKNRGGEKILANPDGAQVTDVKQERGFVYVNLNGGDSWGYYFPEDRPQVLYNFKGEPPVYLEQIAPEFYKEYIQQQNTKQFGAPVKPYVFRDPRRDIYYNVLYKPDDDEIVMAYPASSRQKLVDFLAQYAEPEPDHITDWTVEYRPTSLRSLDADAKWMNTYKPSDYLRYADTLTPTDTIPPIIDRIINSVVGNDQESKDHFINWLACLIQTRQAMGTAWVFHGTTGTGKGLLLDKVIRPLIGPDHVQQWTTQQIEDQFNANLEQSSLLWLDEFHVENGKQARMLMDKLKSYITETHLPVRAMRANTYMAPNFLNVIIATNHPDPLALESNDRRYNVAPPQERSLVIDRSEIDRIDGELPAFASFLWNYETDIDQVTEPLLNEARTNMIAAAQTSVDSLFTALREGDLNFFLDFAQSGSLNQYDLVKYNHFESVLRRWCKQIKNPPSGDGAIKVLRDDLKLVYEYCIGTPTTPSKLSRMCRIQRLDMTRMKSPDDNRAVQGLWVRFEDYDEELLNQVLDSGEDYSNFQVINGAKQQEAVT